MSSPFQPIAAGRSWPFEEAERLAIHVQASAKDHVLFETGYGPSGLPHIGTFGEVARTSMLRYAFERLTGLPTRLIVFSDDLDGLRKIPDNIPDADMLAPYLGKPLTQVPDPFGKYESFGQHNNAMLKQFLDSFGFQYEFYSASSCYQSGAFDPYLRLVLEHYDKIMAVMLPTLREERRKTYSPFLPLCPRTGKVLQVAITGRDLAAGTISYLNEELTVVEVPVTGGLCKLQWKVDWALRWRALSVDYEMAGKDLLDSFKASSQICRILGSNPPAHLTYEMFLDEKGEKISKSKGNGLTIDEWLRYAPPESLAYFMFQAPRKARRLYFEVIPRSVDDYLAMLKRYPQQTLKEQIDNPVWHIHRGDPPTAPELDISYNLLLNLASACNAEDETILWGFINRQLPNIQNDKLPLLDKLVSCAIAYYHDFVKPDKVYRAPTPMEREALSHLQGVLEQLPPDSTAEQIQHEVFEVGKQYPYQDLRQWFATLYEVLLGQKEGPRMGSFIKLFGLKETIELIKERLYALEEGAINGV